MNVSPDDPTPVYGWQIRGLQGVANLLQAMSDDNIKFSEHYLGEYEECVNTLMDVLDKQQALHGRR